ncbi:hypothetical protein [Kribbella solani]|uniref:hypothetical protein n=1 Tax=Kribbella solani TaxID=236067 RepID=UPI0029BA19D9|nr:hypothetical protein [Kribbella solani]MDX2972598.1 hypothetical protein [Kribbella solani]
MSQATDPRDSTVTPAGVDQNDPRVKLCSVASSWGFECEWRELGYLGDEQEWGLYLLFRAGRQEIRQFTPARRAAKILKLDPVAVSALPQYDAYIFNGQYLEVGVIGLRNLGLSRNALRIDRLPWVQFDPDVQAESDPDPFALTDAPWTLDIQGCPDQMIVQLGAASPRFSAFSARARETLKISRFDFRNPEGALSRLETIKDNLAFEFDLKYGLAFSLQRRPARPSHRRRGVDLTDSPPPTWPRNTYPRDPLSLYWYARSADRLPLLEFLAYYQVLEYFFHHHFRRDLMARIREQLRDPRFRFDNDQDLTQIIQIASSGTSARGSEEEQLRATIHGSVAKDIILEFIRSEPTVLEGLTGKKKLGSVPQLNLQDRSSDIRDQLGRRIYAIRCRIVHSKIDGGAREAPPLLPFSEESDNLGPDIEVLQFLAQKAIIAGSSPGLT